jgi:16S rRNA processing protein RimM
MIDIIVVGRFGRTHGVVGWLNVYSFTYPKENILRFSPWLIQKNQNNVWQVAAIEKSAQKGTSFLVKLRDCNTPEIARNYANLDIAVYREQLPKLANNEYYWVDLLGLKVVNQRGVVFGFVEELMATGSNDVLVVKGEKKRLIPYISKVVLKVSLLDKVIIVDWEAEYEI